MGTDKALVVVDGQPLARRVSDVLFDAGAERVQAIGGDVDRLGAAGLDARADRWPGEGPLGAIVQALQDTGTGVDAVAVLACDLVHPSTAAIEVLVARLTAGRADVVVPLLEDRPQWLHGVWRTRVARLLGDVFATGERSVHGAVGGLDVEFTDELAPESLQDADVPGDLPSPAPGDGRP